MNEQTCDCCGRPSDRLWSNKAILGVEDKLCPDCFDCWYEKGMTRREEIKAYVLGEETT